MTKLSVNINKFATLRNSRGGNNPNVTQAAIDAQLFGADGITIHPRPDERHIRYNDAREISKIITTEFNIEGNPTEQSFVDLVLEVKPHQVTLVPDAIGQITSNHGWNTLEHKGYLTNIISVFKNAGIRVSIFVDPIIEMIVGAADTGTDRIELYTEAYAKEHSQFSIVNGYINETSNFQLPTLDSYIAAAQKAKELGLGINAGHDLELQNLKDFKQAIPFLDEVSIGHALVCDAIYLGFQNTIQMYKRQLID
jgi:pyridoxine 5-phosphate synthase